MPQKKHRESDADAELKKWLTRLFLTFRQEPSPEVFHTYRECLSHLSARDLAMAFPEAIRRATDGYMPAPGQVLFALDALHDKFGAQIPGAHAHCSKCGGTGFITIAARDSLTNQELGGIYKWVVLCREPQNSTTPRLPDVRWQDCKEGRTFIANFAALAGKTPDYVAALFKKRIEQGDGR